MKLLTYQSKLLRNNVLTRGDGNQIFKFEETGYFMRAIFAARLGAHPKTRKLHHVC